MGQIHRSEVPRPGAADRQGRERQGAARHRGARGRRRPARHRPDRRGRGAAGRRRGDTMEYKDGKPGGFDPHKRIPDMDADGIDAAFLYPSLGLFSGAIQDPQLAAATCRAYNRWLADYCKPYPDRLFGIAMLPLQSVDLAIAEMRFAKKELGFRGGFIRPNPYNNKMIHHPRLRAVLGRGRGSRFRDRLPRGRLERHADGRRRPLRGPRRPPHHLAYDGDDAGLHERDLGRRLRAPSEDPHRLSRIGRRLDRAVARPHGPAFRRPGLQRFRPDDAARASSSSAIAGSPSSRSRAASRRWPTISARTRSCGRPTTRIPTASSPAPRR